MLPLLGAALLVYLSPNAPTTLMSSGRRSVTSCGPLKRGVRGGQCPMAEDDHAAGLVSINANRMRRNEYSDKIMAD